jgi:hypothetical protein
MRSRNFAGSGNLKTGPSSGVYIPSTLPRVDRSKRPIYLEKKTSPNVLNGKSIEVESLIECLTNKIPLICEELSSHSYETAESILGISNLTQPSFTIVENVLSPFLLFILSEKVYNEYNFPKTIPSSSGGSISVSSGLSVKGECDGGQTNFQRNNNSTLTLYDSYSQILFDIKILLTILIPSSTTLPILSAISQKKNSLIKESASISSSLTSNFSYISLDSIGNDDYCQVQGDDISIQKEHPHITNHSLHSQQNNVKEEDDEKDYVLTDETMMPSNSTSPFHTTFPSSPSLSSLPTHHHHLLSLLHNLYFYLTLRQELLQIHLLFNLYSSQYTFELSLKKLQYILKTAYPKIEKSERSTSSHSTEGLKDEYRGTVEITQEIDIKIDGTTTSQLPSSSSSSSIIDEHHPLESLFLTFRLEVSCLIHIIECRLYILQGRYFGFSDACQQLKDQLITWAKFTHQHLPILTKSSDGDPSTGTRDKDWDTLLGWMCACYRRWLAVSQLVFQEKKKKMIQELFPETENSITQQDPSATPTLPSHPSFIASSIHRRQTFSITGHGCSHCQSYQHCLCPNSDYHCLNHDFTSLTSAVDQFFTCGQIHFKELSLTLVSLTSDGEFVRRQYLCPPRDQWEVICHPSNLNSRYRSGSMDSLNSSTSYVLPSHQASHLPSPPSVSSFPQLVTELILMSKLTPSSAVTGKYPNTHSPTSQLQRRAGTGGMTSNRSTSGTKLDGISEDAPLILNPTASSGRRLSLTQNKTSNSSFTDLTSATHKPLRNPQPLVPGFTYSHNPLKIHFTPHHPCAETDEESDRRQEMENTDYESKWIETHLPQVKSIIEYHITRGHGLQQAPFTSGRNMSRTHLNLATGSVGGRVTPLSVAGTSFPDFEKKRSPLCVPIFDGPQAQPAQHHPHSRGLSIIASLPGSEGSLCEVPGLGGGGAPNDLASSSYPGNPLGFGLKNIGGFTMTSRVFLIGVALDRKGSDLETKHELISTQQVDDIGRELSRIVKNITEVMSGKGLF